jgi:hypothetical protein
VKCDQHAARHDQCGGERQQTTPWLHAGRA